MIYSDMTEKSNPRISYHYHEWDFSFLIDYILNNHHFYIQRSIPLLEHNLERCLNSFSQHRSVLSRIMYHFADLRNELNIHLSKEEKMLFPYLKKMYIADKNQLELPPAPFGSIHKPIEVMEKEHNNIIRLLDDIITLMKSHNINDDKNESFKMLYQELTEFEYDTRIHFYLESNILFPKAVKLEEKLLKRNSLI